MPESSWVLTHETSQLTIVFPESQFDGSKHSRTVSSRNVIVDSVLLCILVVGIKIIGMVWFSEPATLFRVVCIALILLGIAGLKLTGSEVNTG